MFVMAYIARCTVMFLDIETSYVFNRVPEFEANNYGDLKRMKIK